MMRRLQISKLCGAKFTLPMCAGSLLHREVTSSALQYGALRAVNFDDKQTYRIRSTWYLLKALVLLRLCSIRYLALNSVELMRKTEKVLGTTLTYKVLVKHTIFNYFCAGENDDELKKTIAFLEKLKVGSILDYAAEADTVPTLKKASTASVSGKNATTPAQPEFSMESWLNNYNAEYTENEDSYDDNMKLYLMGIIKASMHTSLGLPGCTATKVSGMCDPQLLARMSAILMSIQRQWCMFFPDSPVPPLDECRAVVGVTRTDKLFVTYDQFEKGLERLSQNAGKGSTNAKAISKEELASLIEVLDKTKSGKISYYAFKDFFFSAAIAKEPSPIQQIITPLLPTLNLKEKEMWQRLLGRVDLLASTAHQLNVRTMIDAEQTFYQLAIDNIAHTLQRRYNKTTPVVYNTYQCYLTYAEDVIFNDFNWAAEEKFIWAGKVVRGAYIVQEREVAQRYHYTSPIWPTYEKTGECYVACAQRILNEFEKHPEVNYSVLFGTHNRQALEQITKMIQKQPQLVKKVFLGQLYAMRDNLTFPLAKARYSVFKYAPYGPVKETVHYLGRRAVENSSILEGRDSDEVRMMRKELFRRIGLREQFISIN